MIVQVKRLEMEQSGIWMLGMVPEAVLGVAPEAVLGAGLEKELLEVGMVIVLGRTGSAGVVETRILLMARIAHIGCLEVLA